MSTFVVPQIIRKEIFRSNTYHPPNSTSTKRRQKYSSFLERLLQDPILQTMADIGKQEGAIKPLPAPQRAHTMNFSCLFIQNTKYFL
ncbi:9356_t:CDS:2 [Entrophospora sp. SA101]|nr:8114_t:CDS:2 [Entrophospora sp. SA101]CAJ0896894.1 9356_t:CDS:2 [Entrophospora sp. SA101]